MNISRNIVLMITFLTSPSCAMEKYLQLSAIEKQLIVQEVQQQGKEKILTELYKEGKSHTPMVYDERSGMCTWRNSTCFNIKKTFDQKNINTDLLTKQIFDVVQLFEKGNSCPPDASWNAEINVLGKRTQYWWLKDADDNFSTIKVSFCPHYYSGDQKAIEEVVNSVIEQIQTEK